MLFFLGPAGDETPRASKPRATVSSEGAAGSSSDKQTSSAKKRTINRNGSVMKLAQNFAAITQNDEVCRRRGYRVSSSTALNAVADSPVEFATPESGQQQQWTSGEILNRHLDHLRIPLTGVSNLNFVSKTLNVTRNVKMKICFQNIATLGTENSLRKPRKGVCSCSKIRSFGVTYFSRLC